MRSLFLAAVIGLCALVDNSAAAQNGDVAAKADEYLNAWAKPGRFTGAVLLARGDKVVFRKAYGMANYELSAPNTPETIFRIGSITKIFTALSILQLEERGLLSAKDAVAKYVPEMPKEWTSITIHQLLTHTSGVPDFASAAAYGKYDDPLRTEAALKDSSSQPLFNPPGERFRYSNSGYILLGRVVEKVSGEKYEDYVTKHILAPAGMVDTAYDHARPVLTKRAAGYQFDGEYLVNAKTEEMIWTHSAGALHSTVDDMYRFDRALHSGKLFSTAIVAKALTPYTRFSAPPPFNFDADYGYGWMIGKQNDHAYVGHGGWVGGFVSQFTRYPDDDAVVIVLGNIETGNINIIARDLGAILLGASYRLPNARATVHPDSKTLARYVGKYQWGPLEVAITMKDGRLYAFGTGQPIPFGMIATSDSDFYVNDAASELHFVTGPDGKAASIDINLDGKALTVSRVAD